MNTKDPVVNKVLKEQVKTHLIENPILNRGLPGCYKEVADAFGISSESVRRIYRTLRENGLVPDTYPSDPDEVTSRPAPVGNVSNTGMVEWSHNLRKGESTVQTTTEVEIKNEKDLLRVCGVDEKEWEVTSWKCKAYNAWIKNKSGKIETKQLYSVHANLSKRKLDEDLQLQKEVLIEEMKTYSPSYRPFKALKLNDLGSKPNRLYEISIPDLHIGKVSWEPETGDSYNIDIACERYTEAVDYLLSIVSLHEVERFLLPVGNDIINVNGTSMTTFKGTPQSNDGRFPQMLQAAKKLLISTIDKLSQIGYVDVVGVPGNHDVDSAYSLVEILDAWYHNNNRVTVDSSPTPRKYYKYGITGLMFTHGDEEKHQDLGLVFATERKDIWYSTQFREVHLGHFHKRKETKFISVDEHQGFSIKVLPSLSGRDAWHAKKSYNSIKGAVGILYDKDRGPIANFPYNILKTA